MSWFALSYDSDEKREYYTERIAEHIIQSMRVSMAIVRY